MPALPTRRSQIMVVDDDPLVREAVATLLQSEGHAVTMADSGPHALSLFQPGRYDVIFTDFFMPAMTGARLAVTIKLQSPAQAIVMLTAHPEKLQSGKCPLPEIDLFIGKPFELENLRAAINWLSPAGTDRLLGTT